MFSSLDYIVSFPGNQQSAAERLRSQRVKKVPVGAINERPWILLRKIRKTAFFGGRSMIAPTSSKENMVF
jgi:hypothetical protein